MGAAHRAYLLVAIGLTMYNMALSVSPQIGSLLLAPGRDGMVGDCKSAHFIGGGYIYRMTAEGQHIG
jgi:hypothetical protein